MPSVDRIFDKYNGDENCTGCSACQNICRCNAIEMHVDIIEGYRPSAITRLCIDCGKCIEVCPVVSEDKDLHFPMEGYAAVAIDSIRKKSSSGGFFP